LSETTQETVPGVLTSAVPQAKELNAEGATTMAFDFLKRFGLKGSLKPERVSLEGDLYTVEVELKKSSLPPSRWMCNLRKLRNMTFNLRGKKALPRFFSEGSHADDCYLWCGYCRHLLRLEDAGQVTLFTSD
jgi:hypothetical protein